VVFDRSPRDLDWLDAAMAVPAASRLEDRWRKRGPCSLRRDVAGAPPGVVTARQHRGRDVRPAGDGHVLFDQVLVGDLRESALGENVAAARHCRRAKTASRVVAADSPELRGVDTHSRTIALVILLSGTSRSREGPASELSFRAVPKW
jgi:hypothetical protein